jgi:heme/copper-type cytochrome/quinol oxidase subunit 3
MEINWNLAHGINGESGIFFTVYYYLTFNHLVHATWGILGILWVLARHLVGGYTAEDHRRPGSTGQLLARHRHHLADHLPILLRTGLNHD